MSVMARVFALRVMWPCIGRAEPPAPAPKPGTEKPPLTEMLALGALGVTVKSARAISKGRRSAPDSYGCGNGMISAT